MALGIDIHPYYQRHVTSWPAVRDGGVRWVYVKVSDGTAAYHKTVSGIEYVPDTHVHGAQSVGLPVGGYHYAQFGDPRAQAAVLVREVRRLGCTLPPMLDMESPFTANLDAANFAIAFCRAVADAGYRPAVYMSASWAKVLRPDQWNIPGLVIWIAAYGTNTSRLPYGGTSELVKVRSYYGGRLDIHQFGSTGHVAGIVDTVDVNQSFIELGEDGDMPTPNDLWSAPVWHHYPDTPEGRATAELFGNAPGDLVEEHPAGEWLTAMAVRTSELRKELADVKAVLAEIRAALVPAVADE